MLDDAAGAPFNILIFLLGFYNSISNLRKIKQLAPK